MEGEYEEGNIYIKAQNEASAKESDKTTNEWSEIVSILVLISKFASQIYTISSLRSEMVL